MNNRPSFTGYKLATTDMGAENLKKGVKIDPRPQSLSSEENTQQKIGIHSRHINRITNEAHGRFVMIVSITTLVLLLWASLTEINKVTRGSGKIVPQRQKQEIQHLEGGIIADILVKEGDDVSAGQPLMRVENTFFKSELAQADIELAAKRIKLARLNAEIKREADITFPSDIGESLAQSVENEISLFRSRKRNLSEQTAVLQQQTRQKEIELSELRSRQPSLTREKQIMEERLAILRKLSASGAASSSETLEADRMLQQLFTRISDLAHDIPKIEASLAEIEQRKLQLLSGFQADAEKERTQTIIETKKLSEGMTAMHDRIRRSDVIAPIAGSINKLNVTTVGGVIKPGEALAEIVPADSSIGVEMKLSPNDRGSVWLGAKAIVKISAYEYSTNGSLSAKITDISSDALQDEKGTPYFKVKLEAEAGGLANNKPILPGMLAEVDVLGEKQSVLSSILQPLRRLKDNALRQ